MLLLVLGHCSLLMCHLQEFVYVDGPLTWIEAQSYCRENHSDLLTVYDMKHSLEIFKELGRQGGKAWIGLQKVSSVGAWQWSQPGVDKHSAHWDSGEPNGNDQKIENCAYISAQGLHDVHCDRRLAFSCYHGEDILLLFIMFSSIITICSCNRNSFADSPHLKASLLPPQTWTRESILCRRKKPGWRL